VSEHPAVEWLREAHQQAEELARAAGGDEWSTHPHGWHLSVRDAGEHPVANVPIRLPGGDDHGTAGHIALHDPAAVLRRVAAERELLAAHRSVRGQGFDGYRFVGIDACASCGTAEEYAVPWPCRTVLLLAKAWGWTEGAES
jgi:hypothetical protein